MTTPAPPTPALPDAPPTAPATWAQPVPYHQLLRTWRHRWWMPLLSLAIALPLMLVGFVGPLVSLLIVSAVLGVDDPTGVIDELLDVGGHIGWQATMLLDIEIALLGLAAFVAVGLSFRAGWGAILSVTRRFRLRWFFTCLAALLPVWAVEVVGLWALSGGETRPRAGDWLPLVGLALVLTPFQAAGEEFFCRGWMTQAIASWFRGTRLGWSVATVVATAVFVAMHGSGDAWTIVSLAAFGLGMAVVTLLTGGLEAACAMHATNNIVVGIFGALTGTGDESYVTEASRATWDEAAVSVVQVAIGVGIVAWLARRQRVQREGLPLQPPVPAHQVAR